MKITRVSVEELFYTYTYAIDINTDNPVSIIHAPNGYGKTTVFKLIRDTFNVTIQSSQTSTKLKTKFHCKKTVILSIYNRQ